MKDYLDNEIKICDRVAFVRYDQILVGIVTEVTELTVAVLRGINGVLNVCG